MKRKIVAAVKSVLVQIEKFQCSFLCKSDHRWVLALARCDKTYLCLSGQVGRGEDVWDWHAAWDAS